MSVTHDEVLKIARLAELEVSEDALRFRTDEVKPIPLAFGPETLAPAFKDGFFLVPKLGAFEGADS